MRHFGITVLRAATIVLALSAALPARAAPWLMVDDGMQTQRGDFRHAHRLQREFRNSGRLPEAVPQRPGPPPAADQLNDDERRGLRNDLERADRELYRK